MFRFDLSSSAVVALAVASSLSAAFWTNHVGHVSRAEAATPVTAGPSAGGTARIVRGSDGHYWANAEIDGRAVRVLVDTGASVVALTRQDAARLGLHLVAEDFNAIISTAAGPVRAASVELPAVAVAGARVERVAALVVESGLPHSLLGMSYLGRLSSLEATPAGLTLRA